MCIPALLANKIISFSFIFFVSLARRKLSIDDPKLHYLHSVICSSTEGRYATSYRNLILELEF